MHHFFLVEKQTHGFILRYSTDLLYEFKLYHNSMKNVVSYYTYNVFSHHCVIIKYIQTET